ncbi:hypothetical protein [Aquimarina algiphila]|uniref:Pre-toxin TG domain-containing protein n=1 Tax=Aquimarina algiphila TaxID=2047982 RepID=A0A554VRL1_9FLAO|nr:hypothetical protein [Aquimarina algiphila]TSE11285.1 hypothetical protein FOF46_01255 [Aquimarina algiphila]
MKSIYKILIIGIVFLLSANSHAQFESKTDITDFDEYEAKAGLNACYCDSELAYNLLLQRLDQLEGQRKQEWLEGQQVRLKNEIDRRLNETHPNYAEAEKQLLKRHYKGDNDAIINPLAEQASKNSFEDKRKVQQRRVEYNVLTHRDDVSDILADYTFGDLTSKGVKIKGMTRSQIFDRRREILDEINHTYKPSANASSKFWDGLKKVIDQEYILNRMAELAKARYDSYSVENRVKVITKLLVERNFGNGWGAYNEVPLVYNTNEHNYRDLALIRADQLGNVQSIPPTEPTGAESIAAHALTNISPSVFANLYQNEKYKDITSEINKFFNRSNYHFASIRSLRNVINFQESLLPRVNASDVSSYGIPPVYQSASNTELAMSFRADRDAPNYHTWRGVGNVLAEMYETDFLPNSLQQEGFIIAKIFNSNGISVPDWVTNQALGEIFDFNKTPYGGKPGSNFYYRFEVIFKPSIGIQLWNQSININNLFDDPIHIEGASALARGESFNFAFRKKVYAFSNALNLNTSQRDWLIDDKNRKEFDILYDFFENNGYNVDNVDFGRQSIVTFMNENMILPVISFDQNFPRSTYMKEIVRMNKWIRLFGNRELGQFIEAITPNLPSLTNQELYNLYSFTWEAHKDLKLAYYRIPIETVVVFQPFVELILFDTGIGVAIALLEKLPAAIRSAEILAIINRLRSASQFGELKHAKTFGINTYNSLVSTFKALGLSRLKMGVQFHHLFEQRFVTQLKALLGANTGKWESVVLTVEEHQKITQAWRRIIGYNGQAVGTSGKVTATATLADIQAAAKEVYKNYPEILKALGL